MHTEIGVLDQVLDILGTLDVGDDNSCSACIEGGRQADLVVFRNANNDKRVSLRVMLGSVDAA